MSKSQWFINKDRILIIRRDLAELVGLDQAIVLSQLNYWLENENAGIYYEGYKWIYNTYEEWRNGRKDPAGKQVQEPNFPFWSVRTIQRIFIGLEQQGMIVSCQPNKGRWDHGKYYRIDYEKLDELLTMPN